MGQVVAWQTEEEVEVGLCPGAALVVAVGMRAMAAERTEGALRVSEAEECPSGAAVGA